MSVYGGNTSAGFTGSRYGFGVLAEYVAGQGDCLVAFFGFGFGMDDYDAADGFDVYPFDYVYHYVPVD